jgi:hypothetical protein
VLELTQLSAERFSRWFRRHRPDEVLALEKEFLPWLAHLRKKSRPTSVSPAGSPSCKSCPSWSETGFSEALCVTPANGATQEYQDLPFRSAGMKTLDWVGFISCLGQIECR